MQPLKSIVAVFLGMTLASSVAASEYCTWEQYQHDRALIENATSNGTLVKGPNGLRDSILVQEDMWFSMNYPQQIDFMQSFECAMGGAGGKKVLYMDVRSLATGKLLTTWTLGALTPAEESHNPTNLATPAIAQVVNSNLYLIALAGQSNMSGAGSVNDLPSGFPKNGLRIWNFTKACTWEIAKEPVDTMNYPPGVGPALAMADAFTTQYPHLSVGLIPCAKGGSS